jgi:phosphatidate phosphatase PAH1
LEHDLLGDIVEKYLMDFANMLFEIVSLFDSSGESINQISLGGVVDKSVNENLDGKLEGNKSSFSLNFGNLLTIFGLSSDLFSHEITGGKVLESELSDDSLTLSSFTGSRSSEYENDLGVTKELFKIS